jgi:hypothetical protein
MSDTNPLAGLTADQADQAIDALADKLEAQEASLKAAKAHLKEMKAARKTLTDPQPSGNADNGVQAHAQTAEVAAEGVDL